MLLSRSIKVEGVSGRDEEGRAMVVSITEETHENRTTSEMGRSTAHRRVTTHQSNIWCRSQADLESFKQQVASLKWVE